jgi:N-acetylneuraminic acid mutarotase
MIKKILSLTLFLLALSYLSFAQTQWTQRANFTGTPGIALNFVIGTKGYAVMRGTMRDLWEWDQSTNTWAQKADYTGNSTREQACFSIGTKGYLGTGYTSGNPAETKEFFEWDQATNVWTAKTNFGGVRRRMAVGFSIGTKGYIGSGQYYYLSTDTELSDFWEYDPAGDTWTQKANITGVRYNAAAFVIGSKAYVGTGQSSLNSYKNDLWEFDPVANTWTQKASMATARAGAMAFAIGTKGYVGLGGNGSGSLIDFWEWNQGNNTWLQVSNFPGTSRWLGGFAIGAKGYSNIGQSATDFWEFDPSAPVACNIPPVTAAFNLGSYLSDLIGVGNALSMHAITPLSDTDATFYWQINGVTFDTTLWGTPYSSPYTFNDTGTYVISMISVNQCQSDTAYDTIRAICNGVWVQKGDSPYTNRNASACFTIDNKAYVRTGLIYNTDYTESDEFWVWDKNTDIWTQKADFGVGVQSGGAAFAIGDKGYIIAGDSTVPFAGSFCLNDVWEYNTNTNIWTQKNDLPITGTGERAGGLAFAIAGKGYFGLGSDCSGGNYPYVRDFWEYNPSNDTWTQKATFAGYGGVGAQSFILNDKAYVCQGGCYLMCGYTGGSNATDFWEYDPATNVWSPKAKTLNEGGGQFSINTYGYLLNDHVYRYDVSLDEWVKLGPVPTTGVGSLIFGIGNNGYWGWGNTNDFWEFYPDSCDAGLVTQVKPVEQSKPTVEVYPNPFTTQTTFSLSNEVKNAVLKMYDVNGREVRRVNFTGKQVSIEREGLQSGIYIYSLITNTQVIATGKLVIE